jgi:N-acetylneuraminic acid mutarotase
MTSKKILACSLLSCLLLSACEKWNLEQKDFIEVALIDTEVFSIDSVRMSGLIEGLVVGPITDHGFLWTTQEQTVPSIFFNDGIRSLGVKTIDDEKSFADVVNLIPNTPYVARAYATVDGEHYVYSAAQRFHTGTGSVSTLELHYEGGHSLAARGRLFGTEKGVIATQHGFCWSTVNPRPTLSNQAINLGLRIKDEAFSTNIPNLEENKITYVRAYAVINLDFKVDTVFGEVLAFDGNLNFWTRRTDFGGVARGQAAGFSIEGKGYLGFGFASTGEIAADFWEYDPQTDSWTQKADFAGEPSVGPTTFSIDGRGYVYAPSNKFPYGKQFWEYDPVSDQWTRKADFGGEGRDASVGFSIGPKGYIGLGFNESVGAGALKDFWEYDAQTDQWSRKADFGGEERQAAAGFSIEGKGYVCAGMLSDFSLKNDFWEYDPQTDRWTQKADFGGEPRLLPFGFSIGAKGFVGAGGLDTRLYSKDLWEYDPSNDRWVKRADFGGGARFGAVGFSIDGRGYAGTGQNAERLFTADFWEFDP